MGVLLLISLACTLVASLVFVPAFLAALGPPRRAGLTEKGNLTTDERG
jgi:hypothetical protein